MDTLQDRIRGSLIGGAIGDALGYPVEFIKTYKGIQEKYGERGILFSASFCLKKVICLKMKHIQFSKRAFWDTSFRCGA